MNKANVVCEGLMLGHSGFAEAMRNIALSIDSYGHNVKARILDGDCIGISNTEKGKKLIELRNKEFDDKKIWITMNYPLGIVTHQAYNIGYAMFETEEFPRDFSIILQKQDEVWTPSTFCKEAMERSGLTNVHVMPLGVDAERFNPKTVKPLERSPELEDKFIFLSIFGWSERKGCSLLVEAFAEEFQGCKDVALYLKGGWFNERKARRTVFNKLGSIVERPYIHIDFKLYSDEDLPRLYKMCDCFVMSTRGEGWGLEFSEAMAMEMPTIATRWGGQMEFMNDDNSYLIDIDGTKPCPECDWITPYYRGQNFADPNKECLKKLMRYVYENQKEAKEKGKYARQFMIENFTWEKSMQKVNKRINEIWGEMSEKESISNGN
jgi:glycosyltransferase involved in cell wall biosynthesis